MIGLLAHRFMRSAWGRYLMLGLRHLGWAERLGRAQRAGRHDVDAKARQSLDNIKTMRRMQDAGVLPLLLIVGLSLTRLREGRALACCRA